MALPTDLYHFWLWVTALFVMDALATLTGTTFFVFNVSNPLCLSTI